VCLGYQLTLDEVVKGHNSQSDDPLVITNSGHLTVRYSTGVEQVHRVLYDVVTSDVLIVVVTNLTSVPTSVEC